MPPLGLTFKNIALHPGAAANAGREEGTDLCDCKAMPLQAPWSPNAHAFAQHQFSHVANFWMQGHQASFQLEALPGGRAELTLTFQLPPSQVKSNLLQRCFKKAA